MIKNGYSIIKMKNNIFPCLWFNATGNEAAKFYTDVFGGKITRSNLQLCI